MGENASSTEFELWCAAFRAQAAAEGISSAVLDGTLNGITPDLQVIERDRTQPEFTRPIWDYLDAAVSDTRLRQGTNALRSHAELLARISSEYGVPPEILAAIWGLESAYGRIRGEENVIRSLATLAFDGRRAALFEAQLVAALRIVQTGEGGTGPLLGSWAGAMGHMQFMPTTWLEHAVDFDGDGRRDIWGDDPSDALASAAAYLAGCGWRTGEPWGIEVILPEEFDIALTGRHITKPGADWAALGLLGAQDDPLPDFDASSVLLPGGHGGAAFLVSSNFDVLRRYNAADSYVIAVGLLADRLAGKPPLVAGWPRMLQLPGRGAMRDLQQRLTDAGCDTLGTDGLIGPNTISAIRAYQAMQGLPPDGFATLDLLEHLRRQE